MSTLYLVATPIGNLEDITLRALRILKEADFVLAEDTRNTLKLLNHFEIKTKLISFHEYSSEKKLQSIADQIEASKSVALVSDAGTPLISDPGFKLNLELVKRGINIVPLPGPSALSTALSAVHFPVSKFLFLGFLPHKKGKETLLKEIGNSNRAVVFFESPHRIIKTLERLEGFVDEKREVIVCREMTKIYEEFIRGNLKKVILGLKSKEKIKGEITVVVSPKSK